MEDLEVVSITKDDENKIIESIEIDEIIDLEIEDVEEISIKEFQNNAMETYLYWSSASW